MTQDDATLTLEQIWTESSGSKATVIPGAGFLVRPREASQAPRWLVRALFWLLQPAFAPFLK